MKGVEIEHRKSKIENPLRLLVTAGPTREYVDAVRFLSNASSGRMGCAIARAALARGHEVVLVCGPIEVEPPQGGRVRRVVTTAEMLAACVEELAGADAVVMAAAPADFQPAERIRGKIRKERETLTLELVRTPDILGELARRRTAQVLVGFALEAEDLVARARRKLAAKSLDLIVANSPDAIGAERSTAHFLSPDGRIETLGGEPKEAIAERLVRIVESLVTERRRT